MSTGVLSGLLSGLGDGVSPVKMSLPSVEPKYPPSPVLEPPSLFEPVIRKNTATPIPHAKITPATIEKINGNGDFFSGGTYTGGSTAALTGGVATVGGTAAVGLTVA